MSERTAACPSCGAPLQFRNAATVTVACASCGGLSSRVGADLAKIGKVAEVTPLDSLLDLGTNGRFEGKGWSAVGQVQLDHGAGPWNEWCLLFDEGSWGWLAEAQGELLLTRPGGKPGPVPRHDRLRPGDAVDLGAPGHFVVAEVGSARVVTVRGELPVAVKVGEPRRYADLRQGEKGFATLDYGDDDLCDAVFLGTSVAPADVGLDPSKAPPGKERRVAADRIQCAKCGGEVRLRDPEGAARATCLSCGSLLDPRHPDAGVLGLAARVKSAPRIPLGASGTLRGVKVECIAYLVRSVTFDGTRYPWAEYLLKEKGGRYRWLAESKGHWLFLEPLSAGEVAFGGNNVHCRGTRFEHFQGGMAALDLVYGEVYWEAKVGETVKSDDYVAPPRSVTIEKDGKEIQATLGTYVTPEEVGEAFGVKELPSPTGVAPAQPGPDWGSVRKWWLLAGGFAAADLVVSGLGVAREASPWSFPCCLTFPLLLFPAIVATTKKMSFETERWADSDHPRGSGENRTGPVVMALIVFAVIMGLVLCSGAF